MHQGSALSPLVFVIVRETIYRIQSYLTMGVVVCGDLVVIAETEDDLIKRLNEWKDSWRTEV